VALRERETERRYVGTTDGLFEVGNDYLHTGSTFVC
jgi:hypothetical protein